MTVSMQITKRIYQGNGVTRTWDVDFPLMSADDLRVYLTSPQEVEEEISSDFSIDLLTHTLTYPTAQSGKAPLGDGWKLTVVRATPLTQEIDLLRQGELDAEVLEQGYDKLTMLVQELEEKVNRSIKYPVSSQESDLETENFLANIVSAKQEAVLSSQQAAESAQQAQQTAKEAQQTIAKALEDFDQQTDDFSLRLEAKEQEIYSSAQEYVEQARTEKDKAKDWAVKTDAPVEAGLYSAKKYAQEAALSASSAAVLNKISNCLTKIPQDIKLELSNGTLTLKAGSKAYKGNGEVISISKDIVVQYGSSGASANNLVLVVNNSGTGVFLTLASLTTSGTTEPEVSSNRRFWYDADNKIVKNYTSNSSSWVEVSLPIAIVNCTNENKFEIVRVFNGFGYIGKTLFALPGVEGLLPNGRNADGTLNNTTLKPSSMLTLSFTGQTKSVFGLTASSLFSSTNAVYDSQNNRNYNPTTGNMLGFCNCGVLETDGSGNIISFMPKTVFRALDWHEYDQLSESFYKRTTAYSSGGSNATVTFETPIAVKEGRYLEVVYTAKGKTYASVIPAVFAPLGIGVGQVNRGGQNADLDYDCVMNITVSGEYITAFTSLGRDIYIKRVDVVDYFVRS